MKRTICILLILALFAALFAGCSKDAKETKQMTIDEFFEKYKRSDLETLKTAPLDFLEDWMAVHRAHLINEELRKQYLDWPEVEK